MDAFNTAFDTIIVGALALPWVLLVIHLFFSDNESRIRKLLDWVSKQNQPALAGVLLFAMAYSLGSVVSRIAQDLLDDDDLHIQLWGRLYRVGVTESSIRTDVYCQTLKRKTAAPKPTDPLAERRKAFTDNDPQCDYTGKWIIQQTHDFLTDQWISDQQDLAGDIFHVQEAAVLLKGTDATERLRQFHDQIIVLRGAAFNGLVAFSLCFFWLCARFQSRLRWAVPSVYLVPGAIASANHLRNHLSGPPYLEFALLALAAAGWYVLWQPASKENGERRKPAMPNGRGNVRAYLLLSAFLTVTAFLGWWATQVLYDPGGCLFL
jgi:hypothetical protein